MSERKTTEIKLRVTPAEKTDWQIAAEDEGIGLSELIRREMNEMAGRVAPRRLAWLDRAPYSEMPLVDAASQALTRAQSDGGSLSGYRLVLSASAPDPVESLLDVEDNLFGFVSTNVVSTEGDSSIAPTDPVPTSGDESRVAKPWMFEARNG